MSRCFPFPPPGYEKKARNEGIELLTKKHKEKKYKKEKREKEKREDKERKDRERSKDKLRENKDRKEKHRDRKKDEDNKNDKNKILEERRLEGTIEGYDEEKLGGISRWSVEIKDSKFLELDSKVRDEESGSGNQMAENSTVMHQRTEGRGRLVEKTAEGKERNKGKDGDVKKGDSKRDRDREEKRNKGKDREKEKEKDKVKPKSDHKHKEHDEIRTSVKNKQMDTLNIKLQYPSKISEKIAVTEGNLRKIKDIETNGVLHEIDNRPHKFPRTASFPHLPVENGQRLETCHITNPCTSGRSDVDNKEPKLNGIIETSTSSYSSSPSVSIEARDKVEEATKLPHPDFKYLSQILTVPKMEESSDFDSQDWLFSSNDHRSKPTTVSEAAEETPQVWAEVLLIESADVFALPYVHPY